MATIIKRGENRAPWYLTDELTCPECGAIFQLEKSDFVDDGPLPEPAWRTIKTTTDPLFHIIAGKCPDCDEAIRQDGRSIRAER